MTPPVELDRLLAAVRGRGLLLPDGILDVLMLRGADAPDLLHRLSTNDILRPPPGSPVRTVLTTEKGRIIDDVEVVRMGAQTMVVCHAGALTSVASWIDRFIINEDVEVDPPTPDMAILWAVGGEVSSAMTDPLHHDRRDASPGAFTKGPWSSALGRFPGFRLMVGRGELERMRAEMIAHGMLAMDLQEFHLLRIAAGVPWHPTELNGEHNPLESGLREHVSFTKGCYVGQEVVARLDAYEKVQRGLRVFSVPEATASVGPGTDVLRTGTRVGTLTSVSRVLSDGSCLAMGYVASREAGDSGDLTVAGADGHHPLLPFEPVFPPPPGERSGPA